MKIDGFDEAKVGEEYTVEWWEPSLRWGWGFWHIEGRYLKTAEKAGCFTSAWKLLEDKGRRLFVVADLPGLVSELVEKGVMKEIDLEEVT